MGISTVIHDYTLEDAYHISFYGKTNWLDGVQYRGIPISKLPLDLWIMQEIVWETKPEVIVETGTWCGGSALYYAHLLERVWGLPGETARSYKFPQPQVISIDNLWLHNARLDGGFEGHTPYPEHPYIQYIEGDSVDPETVEQVHGLPAGRRTMVVLDSNHEEDHVRAELDIYSEYVSEGCYLVVEDTNMPIVFKAEAGPLDAIESFLQDDPRFIQDHKQEIFDLSFCKGGWLKRVC